MEIPWNLLVEDKVKEKEGEKLNEYLDLARVLKI